LYYRQALATAFCTTAGAQPRLAQRSAGFSRSAQRQRRADGREAQPACDSDRRSGVDRVAAIVFVGGAGMRRSLARRDHPARGYVAGTPSGARRASSVTDGSGVALRSRDRATVIDARECP
jgi:hypothetical protein